MRMFAFQIFFTGLLVSNEVMSQALFIRPELGIMPVASVEGSQYQGHYTGISAGLEDMILFGEIGLGHSSSEQVQNEEISRTSFHIMGGIRPDQLFRFSVAYYPLVQGSNQNDNKKYRGSGFGLAMSWQPAETFSLKGEYRYHSLTEEIENDPFDINFSEFMLSISYLFYQ